MISEQLAELLRLSVNSGGSGHGMSYWTDAAACGKRALLSDEKRERWRADPTQIPIFDVSKRNAFVVGSVYHKLHELWRKDKLASTWMDFNEPLQDVSVALGIHLFRQWMSAWPRDFWGRQLAVELNLPSTERGTVGVMETFGQLVNAQPDLAVEIREEDLARVQTRCPTITQPGNYLVDFKTAASQYNDLYYHGGTQALWYPLAWELDFPDCPLEGIIFDVAIKPRANAKDQSVTFHATYASSALNSADALAGLIQQGSENVRRAKEQGLGNRAECIQFGFTGVGGVNVCQFYGRECAGG